MGQDKKSPSTLITILQVVIPVLGTIAVAYFTYSGVKFQVETPLHATQTADAKSTEFALTFMIPPTNTPSSTIRQTETPTFSPTLMMLEPATNTMYTIEAENGNFGPGEIKPRSNASGDASVFIGIGGSLEFPFDLAEAQDYNLRVRYSHDYTYRGMTTAPAWVAIYLDGEVIDEFGAADTGDNGFGWNIFALSNTIALGRLSSGAHTLRLDVYSPRTNPGIEFDAIMFVASPYSYLLEDFEADRLLKWWVPEADKEVYKYEENFIGAHTGERSFSLVYNKTSEFQFIGAELPPELRDLSTSTHLELWVYGEVSILIKLQDEESKEVDVEIQSTPESNTWNRLQFDISRVANMVDLAHIKNILFFIAPGDNSSTGTIYIDDIAILNYQ